MVFSLQHHLGGATDDVRGERLLSLKHALALNVASRDVAALKRLKFSSAVQMETPAWWKPVENDFHDTPAKKHEKSVFYFLHHALYSGAFYLKLKDGDHVVLPQFPETCWPFLLMHVEEGASVTVVDDYGLMGSESTPFRGVMLFVGAKARVRWAGYQHHAADVVSFDHKWFRLEEGARLDFFNTVVGGAFSLDETVVELVGRDSSAESQVLFFGEADQRHDMKLIHVHEGQGTVSRMVSKGAVQDSSYGSFWGMIQMEPGCDGADGYLEEHNLLLSDRSKIDAVPGLEIGHHDVKAGHAATMERVDDEKLFYLASRGIPADEALRLIVEGFFLDALQRMKFPEFEDRIFQHILSRLS